MAPLQIPARRFTGGVTPCPVSPAELSVCGRTGGGVCPSSDGEDVHRTLSAAVCGQGSSLCAADTDENAQRGTCRLRVYFLERRVFHGR